MSAIFRGSGRIGLAGWIGGALAFAVIAVAAFGPWLAPYDPMALDLRARLSAPYLDHLLGTGEFGRDILSRLIFGARVSIFVALSTVAVALVIGVGFGVLTGFVRAWTDRIIGIFNDALLAFPGLLLALGVMAVAGASAGAMVLALGLAFASAVLRVTRSAVLSQRAREFVEASRVMGNSEALTMWRHVLPNALAPLIVLATSMFGWVILAESALSFLGLGVPPPAPSWGNMLAAARPYIQDAPWLIVLPGLCIQATLLGVNLLGDALRDLLDPRMRT
ncbi:ABC transporter permease subunit [Pseudooceanicola sp. 216_PA32_1]|uniref:ABC transporter permease subunit n=1 Tax=Pseudooceanicola pacificus TaxID=2676438 RepID=A0A844WDV6_9RHOB|nr:ABC transporter permease [Pseudooceanicola pacificus]MWB77059.1 ABC transporter permease subunit [Pseudooceanicola pacificus]